MRSTRFVLAVFAFISVSPVVRAEQLTLNPSKDNTLYESGTGGLSNGQGPFIYAGQTSGGALRRGLLAFDLATIPAGVTITGVSLTLFVSESAPSSISVGMTLHRLLRDWGEGTSNAGTPGGVGAASTSGDATWLHNFYSGSLWTTPGGDFSALASATTAVGSGGTTVTWSGAGLIADVEAWLAGPGTNFGWILRGDELTNQNARRFNSGENTMGMPVLAITYAPVPEPAAGGFVLAGCVAVFAAARYRNQRRAILG